MTDNIVFSGSLRFVTLADVFQLLGGNNCTGILKLQSQYSPHTGIIYFIKGNPVNASYGGLTGLQAVHALFGWMDGKYEFSEEELDRVDRVIKQSRMEVVLDALRSLDDGEIEKVGLPSPDKRDVIKTGAKGAGKDLPHPIKGPLVDYTYVIREESYEDGATIVREGKYGKWLWLIYEGVARVTRETAKGPLTLARLGDGCFIGTIRALLYGEYERSATVTAEGTVRLCILDAEPLHREYSSLSENFRKILLSLDKRMRILNDSAVQTFTKENLNNGLSKDKGLDDRFKFETDLYMIKNGTADIIGKGPKGNLRLLSLDKDDVLGKIPFIDFGHEPVSASVMVSNSFKADVLDSRALQEEYNNLSHTFKNFIFNTGANISMTTRLLYQLLGNV
jgi:hypothetical protein